MRDDPGPDPGGLWRWPSCESHSAREILRQQGTSWDSASSMQRFSAVIAANLRGRMDRLSPEILTDALNESHEQRYGYPDLMGTEFHDLIVALVITSIAAGNPHARYLAEWAMRWFGVSIFIGAFSSEARYEQQEKEIRYVEMLRTMADLSLSINDVNPEFLRLLTGKGEGGS